MSDAVEISFRADLAELESGTAEAVSLLRNAAAEMAAAFVPNPRDAALAQRIADEKIRIAERASREEVATEEEKNNFLLRMGEESLDQWKAQAVALENTRTEIAQEGLKTREAADASDRLALAKDQAEEELLAADHANRLASIDRQYRERQRQQDQTELQDFLSGGNVNSGPAPTWYSGLNVSSSQLDLPIPIFWGQRRLSTNAIWYGNFQKHSANGKGKGGLSKGQSQNYTYSAATIVALCEGVVDSIARAWSSGSTTTTATLSQLNQTFFYGTAAQSPWSYTLTNYPTQARAYARTAYLASPLMHLGSSASIPDNAYECVRANGFAYTKTSPGWIDPATHVQATAIDCLMSDIITDLLTNTQYGLGFTRGDLGDMTQYALYQRAQGFFFSPLLNQQSKGTEILDRWAQLSNAWIYWDGTGFQFVPLGDSAVTCNGVTYTPDLSPAYALGVNDFLGGGTSSKEPPLKVSIVAEFDAKNTTRLTITDRTIGYVSNPSEWKDQDLVDQYGVHDSGNVSGDDICCPAVGTLVCQLIGKRNAYIRRTYAWKSSYRLIRLLPGSIVTLTEPNIGLNAVRVRIRTVAEQDDGTLEFEAEEMP